jgi:hypothetical protein
MYKDEYEDISKDSSEDNLKIYLKIYLKVYLKIYLPDWTGNEHKAVTNWDAESVWGGGGRGNLSCNNIQDPPPWV